ncbi:MAG: hypothetical protein J6M39_07860 [Lachnospiraceae bacterium]|nr:hypothetical protein [Lachnospiraceae bacterium]
MSNLIEQKIENGTGNTNIAQQNNYNGVSIEQAMQICFDLFYKNFPKLQEEAQETAKKYLQDNCKEIINNIIIKKNIDFYEFTRPDCQYSLEKILIHQALYNEREKNKLLSDLLINKLSSDFNSDKQINIIMDRSIELSTQLSLKQIDLLSVICISKNVKFETDKKFTNESFVKYFNEFLNDFNFGENFNYNDIGYLLSLGCLQISYSNVLEGFCSNYSVEMEYINKNLSKTFLDMPNYALTPVAIPIAISNINNKKNKEFEFKQLLL